jgi:vacuolar-type H+-ATPase subunit F/Vma7
MMTVVIGGAMFAGLFLLAGRGKDSSMSQAERAYKLQKIEEKIQQTKDKTLYELRY